MSNQTSQPWELTILNETAEGMLVSAPNGDTAWMTREQYETYLVNSEKLKGKN